MPSENFNQIVELLDKETKKMWHNESEDVKDITAMKGAFKFHFSPALMGESEMRILADDLWYLRAAAKESGSDIRTLQMLTSKMFAGKQRRFENWYHMRTLATLLDKARVVCEQNLTQKEYVGLIERLSLYVGRLSWWIELKIPWNDLSVFYESVAP